MQYINIMPTSEIGFIYNKLVQVSATQVAILTEAMKKIRS